MGAKFSRYTVGPATNCANPCKASECGGKPSPPRVLAKEPKAQHLGPVKEHGLIKARRIKQPRRDEVAPSQHFAGGLREGPLVEIREWGPTQLNEQDGQSDCPGECHKVTISVTHDVL